MQVLEFQLRYRSRERTKGNVLLFYPKQYVPNITYKYRTNESLGRISDDLRGRRLQ